MDARPHDATGSEPRRLVLTGGGTAGHVTPNLALLPGLRARGFAVHYLGSGAGIEKTLCEKAGLPFHPISSGKLRRYLDPKNFSDPFRVAKGVFDAFLHLRRIRPALVFSKGGFVAVPVVLAARILRIPVLLHESDLSPGLANRICLPFARYACCSFPETLAHLPKGRSEVTGSPIRAELYAGEAEKGRAFLGFEAGLPVLLAMGGSLGSRALNRALREALPHLRGRFQVVHLCGKAHLDPALEAGPRSPTEPSPEPPHPAEAQTPPGAALPPGAPPRAAAETARPPYRQFEYLGEELPQVLALADLVVSRAGANSLFELLALKKPHLLIPLPLASSRGDQIQNAASFARQGFSKTVREEDLLADPARLPAEILDLWENRHLYQKAMEQNPSRDGTARLLDLIENLASARPTPPSAP